MTVPFMRAYTELLVRTCHRRGAHAIGGMAAFIPNRRDPAVTEVGDGQGPRRQGARVAATGSTARGSPIRISSRSRPRSSIASSATGRTRRSGCARRSRSAPTELLDLRVPGGAVTEAGVRANVRVALAYLDSWLRGVGAAAIDNLMEDAATAEISRSQLWQWRTRGVALADGRVVRRGALRRDPRRGAGPPRRRAARAGCPRPRGLLDRLVLDDDFAEFLTLRAYSLLD